jgi:hypothetical protein
MEFHVTVACMPNAARSTPAALRGFFGGTGPGGTIHPQEGYRPTNRLGDHRPALAALSSRQPCSLKRTIGTAPANAQLLGDVCDPLAVEVEPHSILGVQAPCGPLYLPSAFAYRTRMLLVRDLDLWTLAVEAQMLPIHGEQF